MNWYIFFFGGCATVILSVWLGGRAIASMNQSHPSRPAPGRRSWVWRNSPEACCLDVPCSNLCSSRQYALVITGVSDGAAHPAGVRELVRRGQQLARQPGPAPEVSGQAGRRQVG